MDGYRARNHKETAYTGARRTARTASAQLARAARAVGHVLSLDRAVSAFRYALVAASFVFLLSVVAAMESGRISLGAGLGICGAIGVAYLIATRRLEDGEEEE